MSKFILPLVVALALAPVTSVYAQCDFSDIPVMSEMQVSSLMDNAQYNNRPMAVRSFTANVTAESVASFYRRSWRDRYSESTFGPWQQIGTLEGECFFTVQYGGAGDSSFGRLLISKIPQGDGGGTLGAGVVKPGDAMVVSDLLTDDDPKEGRVTMITSQQSVAELVSFYRTEMASNRWSLEQEFNQGSGAVLVFRKGINENNIVIMPAGDATQILINEVEVH